VTARRTRVRRDGRRLTRAPAGSCASIRQGHSSGALERLSSPGGQGSDSRPTTLLFARLTIALATMMSRRERERNPTKVARPGTLRLQSAMTRGVRLGLERQSLLGRKRPGGITAREHLGETDPARREAHVASECSMRDSEGRGRCGCRRRGSPSHQAPSGEKNAAGGGRVPRAYRWLGRVGEFAGARPRGWQQ
jgi:hypothetical protein